VLLSVAGILFLGALAVLVITSVIDPNRYRGKVETIVADLAGRPFVIDGDLQITWFPWLGVRTGAAHLNNQPGIQGPPLAEWQSVAVAAKVLPLLKGQVIIDRVRLQGPHVRLIKNAQGHGNWEDLGPRPSAASKPAAGPPEIAGIEIRDGEMDYVDEASGVHLSLSSWELETGEWRPGIPLAVHMGFLARGGELNPVGVRIQIDAPELTVGFEPFGFATPELAIKVADAQVVGPIKIQQTGDASGSVVLHVPDVRKLAEELGIDAALLPKDLTTLGKLEARGSWSFKDGALTAKPVAIQLDETKLEGWVERSGAPQLAWRFDAHGDRIDLGRYTDITRKRKPFELPVKALRGLNANGVLSFDQVQFADTHMNDVRLRFESPEGRP